MRLRLIEKYQVAPDAYTFVFQPAKPLDWQAGQYMIYTLPHANIDDRKDRRFFSIASAPFEKNIYITTRFTGGKGSSFKRALAALPIGDEIEGEGPSGGFTADGTEDYVFIAGGIGITAIRSILADLDQRKIPIKGQLLYANRDAGFIYKDNLEAIAGRNHDFKIRYFIEPERITEEAIRRLAPDLSKPVFYVSGPEPMVQAMEKLLAGLGVAEKNIKRDYFPGYGWP